MNIQRLQTKRKHPARKQPARCVILHSTGGLDEKAIVHYYQTSSEGVCPHFLVLRDGRVLQFEDLDHVAYHTAMSDDQEEWYRGGRDVWTRRLKDGTVLEQPYPGYGEWLGRWTGLASPLELPSTDKPNTYSVGIELLCERGLCTDEQYQTLSELVLMVAEDLRMELGEDRILTHYFANPVARADKFGGTDPGPYFEMSKLLASLE